LRIELKALEDFDNVINVVKEAQEELAERCTTTLRVWIGCLDEVGKRAEMLYAMAHQGEVGEIFRC
jgi:hypothetical protein